MFVFDEELVETPAAISMNKQPQPSTTMERTSAWVFSQEIPSDITVEAGGASFSLHKFPLVSKCGYFRKLVFKSVNSKVSFVEIPDIPGGSEAFELSTKFCYGINIEINTHNIVMLRCVAEYLEMTEDYAAGNLVNTTESYLQEMVLTNLTAAITVLNKSEDFLPLAERVKLVNRCIDTVANMACNDSQFCSSLKTDSSLECMSFSSLQQPKTMVDWWAEEFTVLKVGTFQRVLMAMKAKGFNEYALGPVLMLYVQKSLRGLDIFGRGRKNIEPKHAHEKRVVLETVVSLLPRQRNALSVSFISMLLRAAICLETTVACRLELERRMGLQLRQAVLDDLLIPSFSFDGGDTEFDVDTVQRILMNYLEQEGYGSHSGYQTDDECLSPLGDVEWVGRLVESYLVEIASDSHLAVARFISLAEMIPEQARSTEDGLYRAIDVYLKAHPSLNDIERKKVCTLMDCQKLSREACAHAAQNDRLPVQTVVQVLYQEQQRLRDSMEVGSPALPQTCSNRSPYCNPPDELSRLRRENAELKQELARLRMRLKDMEKPISVTSASGKPPLPPKKSLVASVSKKLGRLNPFVSSEGIKPLTQKVRSLPAKVRRYSIS